MYIFPYFLPIATRETTYAPLCAITPGRMAQSLLLRDNEVIE